MGGAVLQALAILEQYPSDFLNRDTTDRHQVVAESFHLSTVDHERYLMDESAVAQQSRARLISKDFAAERA
jgi:gamma-glutamyltranspeptidase